MSEGATPSLFISHDHLDLRVANALNKAIEELFDRRVPVRYSTKRGEGGIPTGTDWFRWIGQQVKSSQVTVVLMTPQFLADPSWLLWESAAVYGIALGGQQRKRPPVRPLSYRVDAAGLPKPLRAANLHMTKGDDADEMRDFLLGLLDDFDVLTRAETAAAGERLGRVIKTYIEEVEEALEAPTEVAAAVPPRDPDTLEKLLGLTLAALQALNPAIKMNGRYFYAATEHGREFLVREDDVYCENLPMPSEFGLSRVDVEQDADTIVICESYLRRTPLYRVLLPDLTNRYRPEIRSHIAPSQGWVLACPVLVGAGKPLGVICIYGGDPPARDPGDEDRLLTVAVRLSELFRRALAPSSGDT